MVTISVLALVLTYAVWQMLTMGSLNILNIAQITYHEAWPVTASTIIQTGLFVLLFFIPGLVCIFLENDSKKAAGNQKESAKADKKARKSYHLNISVDAKLLLLSWIAATVILFKNEMWGLWLSALTHISAFNLSTMQSRFYTYFTEVAIIIAAFGIYWLLSLIDFDVMLEKQE